AVVGGGGLAGGVVREGRLVRGALGQSLSEQAEVRAAGPRRLVGHGGPQVQPGGVLNRGRSQPVFGPHAGVAVLSGRLLAVGVDAGGGKPVDGEEIGAGDEDLASAGRCPVQLDLGALGVVVVVDGDTVPRAGHGVGERGGVREAAVVVPVVDQLGVVDGEAHAVVAVELEGVGPGLGEGDLPGEAARPVVGDAQPGRRPGDPVDVERAGGVTDAGGVERRGAGLVDVAPVGGGQPLDAFVVGGGGVGNGRGGAAAVRRLAGEAGRRRRPVGVGGVLVGVVDDRCFESGWVDGGGRLVGGVPGRRGGVVGGVCVGLDLAGGRVVGDLADVAARRAEPGDVDPAVAGRRVGVAMRRGGQRRGVTGVGHRLSDRGGFAAGGVVGDDRAGGVVIERARVRLDLVIAERVAHLGEPAAAVVGEVGGGP